MSNASMTNERNAISKATAKIMEQALVGKSLRSMFPFGWSTGSHTSAWIMGVHIVTDTGRNLREEISFTEKELSTYLADENAAATVHRRVRDACESFVKRYG